MSEMAKRLLAEALSLPAPERLELADLLYRSLDGAIRDPDSVRTTTEIKAADVIARLKDKGSSNR